LASTGQLWSSRRNVEVTGAAAPSFPCTAYSIAAVFWVVGSAIVPTTFA
jgi:hypothetical protein